MVEKEAEEQKSKHWKHPDPSTWSTRAPRKPFSARLPSIDLQEVHRRGLLILLGASIESLLDHVDMFDIFMGYCLCIVHVGSYYRGKIAS